MTPVRYRIAGVIALALSAVFLAAGTVGAKAPPVAHYVAPARPVPPAQNGGFIRVAGLFGESDEEKEARLQHEQNQDDAINRLNARLRDLEDTLRNLTGHNEELSHRIGELNDKIDRQQKDFEYRLCALAAQQLGAATGQGDPNALPCGATASTGALPPLVAGGPNGPAPQDSGGRSTETGQTLAPPPGVLGTLPAGEDRAPPRAATGSSDSSRAQFQTAMNLLAKARYDEASAAFRSFADANPDDDLASQAVYWVADIAYVQKDYGNAARGFAEVIKKYPTALRAPDSMLKLGQSLIAAGQKKEGCTALAALPAKYPKAAKAVLAQGADARKASCRAFT
ncbi:MAG TPA: tol-pal system protein YbgF [Rhizomicrobium sp.]